MQERLGYPEFMEKAGAHLELSIDTPDPLEVREFGDLLGSFAAQYDEFVQGTYPDSRAEARFYVQEVRKGSIIIEFAAATIGMMDQTIILKQFLELTKDVVSAYLGTGIKPPDPNKRRHMVDMVKAIAQSQDGKLALAYRERDADGSEAQLIIGKDEAKDILQNAANLPALNPPKVPDLESPTGPPKRALMRLYQHNQDPKAAEKKSSAHKAVVSEFSDKPKPITYEAPEVADEIAKVLEDEPYASTIFDVTVAPRLLDGKLKAYNVIKLHEWFPDDEPPDQLSLQG